MRFLYYDRIVTLEKGKKIHGIKAFSLSEEFLRSHFEKQATIPGVIFIEAMAQLLGWLIIYTHDFKLSAIMSLVEGVQVPARLRPGFSADIEAEIISSSRSDSLGKARVSVEGEVIASMERIIYSHFHKIDPRQLAELFSYYSGLNPEQSFK